MLVASGSLGDGAVDGSAEAVVATSGGGTTEVVPFADAVDAEPDGIAVTLPSELDALPHAVRATTNKEHGRTFTTCSRRCSFKAFDEGA